MNRKFFDMWLDLPMFLALFFFLLGIGFTIWLETFGG